MSSNPDVFPATLGRRERWSTLAAVVLTAGGLTILGFVFAVTRGDPRWMLLGLPFTLMVFALGRFAQTGYRVAADGLHVERKAGSKVIAYRTIRAVDRAERRVSGVTVFGSKGVFGCFGRYWNPSLGFYQLYLTNREHVVWLASDAGLVGLSPDRPDEFVRSLRGILGQGV